MKKYTCKKKVNEKVYLTKLVIFLKKLDISKK